MKINNKYQLTSDSMNIILQEKAYNKIKKKHYWRNIGYFGTPYNALIFLIKHEIKGTGFTDLEKIVAKIDELHKLIDGLKGKPLPELL